MDHIFSSMIYRWRYPINKKTPTMPQDACKVGPWDGPRWLTMVCGSYFYSYWGICRATTLWSPSVQQEIRQHASSHGTSPARGRDGLAFHAGLSEAGGEAQTQHGAAGRWRTAAQHGRKACGLSEEPSSNHLNGKYGERPDKAISLGKPWIYGASRVSI